MLNWVVFCVMFWWFNFFLFFFNLSTTRINQPILCSPRCEYILLILAVWIVYFGFVGFCFRNFCCYCCLSISSNITLVFLLSSFIQLCLCFSPAHCLCRHLNYFRQWSLREKIKQKKTNKQQLLSYFNFSSMYSITGWWCCSEWIATQNTLQLFGSEQ